MDFEKKTTDKHTADTASASVGTPPPDDGRTDGRRTGNEDCAEAVSEDRRADESADADGAPRRREHRKESKQLLALIAAAVLLLAVWGVSALAGSLIRVREIVVEGSSPYEASVIIGAAGVGEGMRINAIDRDTARENILLALPYISDATVSRGLFGRVKISVEADTARYYAEIAGGYFALSDDFRVLEYSSTDESFSARGLVPLSLPHVKSAMLGEYLSLYGEDNDYISGFLESVEGAGLDGELISVELADRYSISFEYNKYTVIIGKYGEIERKLSIVRSMQRDERLKDKEWAEFDVTDPNNPILRW